MMDRLFLGFDTSNYTTSAALCSETSVLFNRKKLLSVAEGQRGLRQQEAVFQHIKNLPSLFPGENFSSGEIVAVGVSVRPRSVEGSYMPCFTVGESFAEVTSGVLGVPLFRFSHQQGHIAAGLFSVGRTDLLKKRFLAYHLSGGTSELLLVDGIDRITILSSADDITFGQLIDRTGVLLGMKFPCGAEMDRIFSQDLPLAENPRFTFRNGNLCLSGFENKVISFLERGVPAPEIVRYVFEVAAMGVRKTLEKLPPEIVDLPLLFTGGVSSNRYLRQVFSEEKQVMFASPELSCDNAVGAAVLSSAFLKNREPEHGIKDSV